MATSAHGAEFDVKASEGVIGDWVNITMTGIIRRGDYDKFFHIIKTNKNKAYIRMSIVSPGGDGEEAMRIGRLVRKLYLYPAVARAVHIKDPDGHTRVAESLTSHPNHLDKHGEGCPSSRDCICASACVLIWIGGMDRSGNYIGIHRPTFAPGRFTGMSAQTAKREYHTAAEEVRRYIAEMGITPKLFETMMSVSSHEIMVVSEKSLLDALSRREPSFDEWLAVRCGKVSAGDEQVHLHIRARQIRGQRLTADERAFLDKFWKKQMAVIQCESTQKVRAQQSALKEHFR